MLVKYGSGTGGIKEYLEEGKMNGRDLSRRELDERIVLAGDLDICDQVINSRPTDGQKYQHITLSFTEDEVRLNTDLLKEIVDDYAKFARGDGAYSDDELYIYAEAHMPRTKTEVKWNADKKCHETVPRHIHVHIVIPTTNLLTGERAAPFEALPRQFGTAERLDSFTDAWQEDINEKYGFSSPHDPAHARESFGGKADIISRIKGDEFASRKFKNHDKLKMFRNEMLDRGIESEAAFKQMLNELGYEVADKVGHGKNGDYLRVRPTGSDEKYIRLDDDQFRTAFLNKTIPQKLQAYADRKADEYQANKPAAALERARLREAWSDRARAEKYMSYGSKVHKEYLAASPEDKKLLLSKLEEKFYGKAYAELELTEESLGHDYFNRLLADDRNFEMDAEGRAERAKLDRYSNAKLNQSYLRTADQLAAARAAGDAILAKPESALAALTFSQSTFGEGALQRYLLKNTADADQYDTVMRAVLAHPDLIVHHSEKGLLFSTRQIVEIESRLVARAERMAGNMKESKAEIASSLANAKRGSGVVGMVNDVLLSVRSMAASTTLSNIGNIFGLKTITQLIAPTDVPGIPQKEIEAIANFKDAKGRGMNEGQQGAFRLLCSDRQLGVVNGAAGTGKSFILAKMREAYEKQGFDVYGACLQGKTAEDLQRDSKINTRTIAKMLKELEKGRLVFNKKTVLVIDEAGMVGSRDLEKLMAYVERAGGRMRLVGDAFQLAAVEYGNAFVEISKRSEVAALTQIMRQEEDWMKQASEKFSRHDIAALKDYADHGKVFFEDTTKDAQIAIVAKWSAHRAEQPNQTCIVLAHTNAERIELNNMMRDELKRHGKLKEGEADVVTTGGVLKMAIGERVMFTAPDREMGVKNGTTGTILSIDKEGAIRVKLDNDGKIVTFNRDGRGTPEGNSITHGYCMTVHKSQGITVDKCLVLANEGMSLENLYVALTRHKKDVELVASSEQFKSIDDMLAKLDRAGDKAFSVEVERSWQSAERPSDSVVGQLLAEINAEKVISNAAQSAKYQEIVGHLDPQRVLDYVSKTYGADLSKFEIVQADNGTNLIRVGDEKNYNVSTFLTRHMHLNYQDQAAPILKQCYEEQLKDIYSFARYEPGQGVNQQLRNEFADYLKEHELSLKSQKDQLDDEKRTLKAEIVASALSPAEKKQAISELTARIAEVKDTLQSKPMAESYKDFLAEKAVNSDVHLQEFWHVAVTDDDRQRIAAIEAARTIEQAQIKESVEKGLQEATQRIQTATEQAALAEARRKEVEAEKTALAAKQKAEQEKAAAIEAEKAAAVEKKDVLSPADRDLIQRTEIAIRDENLAELKQCRKLIAANKKQLLKDLKATKGTPEHARHLERQVALEALKTLEKQRKELSPKELSNDYGVGR